MVDPIADHFAQCLIGRPPRRELSLGIRGILAQVEPESVGDRLRYLVVAKSNGSGLVNRRENRASCQRRPSHSIGNPTAG